MPNDAVAIRFNSVSFEYRRDKMILDEASFALRRGSKFALMGQNGAGKSTIFKLIKGELKPTKGNIFITNNATIATALQMVERQDLNLTVEEVENDYYITFTHAMSKVHYLSFVAYVTYDRVLFLKLYPEQSGEARFPKMYGGKIYFYCNQHGLWVNA